LTTEIREHALESSLASLHLLLERKTKLLRSTILLSFLLKQMAPILLHEIKPVLIKTKLSKQTSLQLVKQFHVKVRSPIPWVYGGFYTVYYKDVGEFQILYSQDICW
jgi:hypothetical protein